MLRSGRKRQRHAGLRGCGAGYTCFGDGPAGRASVCTGQACGGGDLSATEK